jgi:hypothetical protein
VLVPGRVRWKRCGAFQKKPVSLTIRDTTALQEVSFLKIGRPSPPGCPSQRREAVRGNPKQIGGRSLRGEPRTCRSPLFRDSGRNRFLLLPSGRSQGVVRRAFLGAPAASITGGRVFEARPLTMKRCAALFHRGGREVSAAPFLT